jgi:hypothetical protein
MNDEGKLWRSIVGRKYCKGDNIFSTLIIGKLPLS